MSRNISDKVKASENQSDQEITNKILSYKEKYSYEELKSIISFVENPICKLIAEKLLLSGE